MEKPVALPSPPPAGKIFSSLDPSSFSGAGEGNRTPDPLITNQMLYRLSYASMPGDAAPSRERIPRIPSRCPGQFNKLTHRNLRRKQLIEQAAVRPLMRQFGASMANNTGLTGRNWRQLAPMRPLCALEIASTFRRMAAISAAVVRGFITTSRKTRHPASTVELM